MQAAPWRLPAPGTRHRSDGVAAVVLRRADFIDPAVPAWCPRLPYARALACATNNDGFTKEGITFPSGPAQQALAQQARFFYALLLELCACQNW